ncbi:MAG TPA: TolC family protein [Flavipsychrobacter sp.]|nr:TolC family protein [Flavipsychrobacter sp.]
MKQILAGILLLSGTVATAQQRLSLSDAIAKALEHNFDIRIAKTALQQAERNNTLGNAGFSPNVNATAGVTTGSANTRIEFADGRVQEVANAASVGYNGAVSLGWTLFDGGRMFLNKKLLNTQEAVASAQLKERVQAIVSQTIQAYAAAVFQKQQGVAIDTALVLAKTRMVLSQVKYETGASAKVDFLQARVDYNTRQSDSLTLESQHISSLATLNALMGEEADKLFVLDEELQMNTALQPADKDRLKDLSPSLQIARQNAEASELSAKIAKSFMLPTLSVNGTYSYNRTQSQAGFALFNQSYGPSGGATLNMPLFQGGNLRRQAKVASLQAMRMQLTYDWQNTELSRQYRTAWGNYEMALAAYKLEQENIAYAKENLDIQKARFRVGIANTLETREAENSYVQALQRLFAAAYNLKVSETRVLELEGNLVK